MKRSIIVLGGVSVLTATVLGIQFVAAQTDATSTPPREDVAATSTTEVEESAEAASTSPDETTTSEESTPPVWEGVIEATTSTSTPPTTRSEDTQADKPAPETVTAEISALQENYFKETGSYLQILRGNGLPSYEDGTVAQKLGEQIADDAWVHVYEAPGGKGYQVLYEDAGTLHSVGYGPEAAERTFSRSTVVAPSATSTAEMDF